MKVILKSTSLEFQGVKTWEQLTPINYLTANSITGNYYVPSTPDQYSRLGFYGKLAISSNQKLKQISGISKQATILLYTSGTEGTTGYLGYGIVYSDDAIPNDTEIDVINYFKTHLGYKLPDNTSMSDEILATATHYVIAFGLNDQTPENIQLFTR